MELDAGRAHQPSLQSAAGADPEDAQTALPQHARHLQAGIDVAGRAAAGQRYRGAHRRPPRRRAPYALQAAAPFLLLAVLLLPAVIGAEATPACRPSGRAAGDGRELPAVQRVADGLACMPADTALGREVHERFSALMPSHAFETRGEIRLHGAATADLYDALHAISTLEGIRYFSVWHGDERVLFNTAHAIDGSGAAIADPTPSPDGHDVAYALVDDARFGSTPFRLEYRTADDAILLIVSNLLDLSLLVFPLIDPGRLLIALLITPGGRSAAATADPGDPDPGDPDPGDPAAGDPAAGDPAAGDPAAGDPAAGVEPLALYGLVAAQAPEVPFLEALVEASLRNRLAAMADWIRARAAVVAGQ